MAIKAEPGRSTSKAAPFQIATTITALTLASATLAENTELIDQGEYVARASGCMSCHQEDLSGGYEVETPMGTIVASNISPSHQYGIGGYDRDDLANVLRRGVSPDRRLYPAMPYASYRGMSDADIDALHAWLQNQEPVEEAPEQDTDLPFPFNISTGVIGWNWMFLGERDLPLADDPVLQRGAYLVNHLGHCGECHTPRNDFFGMQDDQYLAGEMIDGWLAPNLTADPESGLGSWSDQDIIDYLRTGQAGNVVQAAGPMADFVRHGTSHLEDDDLAAITAYLRTIPAIATGVQDIPLLPSQSERLDPAHSYGQVREEIVAVLTSANLSEPEQLYARHCAACHGVTGQGQPQAYYPPLVQNAALRRADANNLLQVLLHGVPAGKLERVPAMPGFAGELSADQIAKLANYTRSTFGSRPDSALTAADVTRVLTHEDEMPAPLRTLQVLAWVGVAALIVVVGVMIWWIARRRKTKLQEG
ncbi:MAG: cytochrome c [Loktanella sp.]|nr:cytochrome c [Loktanella sp.]